MVEPILHDTIVIGSKRQAKALYVRLRGAVMGEGRLMSPLRLCFLDSTIPAELVTSTLMIIPSLQSFISTNWAALDVLAVLHLHSSQSLRFLKVDLDTFQWSCIESLHTISYLASLEDLHLGIYHSNDDNINEVNDGLLTPLSDLRPLRLQRLLRLTCHLHDESMRTFLTFIGGCEFTALLCFALTLAKTTPSDELLVLQPFFAYHQLSALVLRTTPEQLVPLLGVEMLVDAIDLQADIKLTTEIRLPKSVSMLHVTYTQLYSQLPWETALPALAVLAWSPEARAALRHIRLDLRWMDSIKCSAGPVDPDGTACEDEEREATTLGRFIFFSQRFARLGIALVDRNGLSLEKGECLDCSYDNI
jgi:hypothetical protein